MQALVFTGIDQPLRCEERSQPKPREGHVVVELKAAALNRRDYWITKGKYPGIKTPVVLGSDGAGVVVETGRGVPDSWADREVVLYPGMHWGDQPSAQSRDFRVLGMPDDGTFATAVAVPATLLYAKPPHLHWQQAAALPLAGVTAYRALFVQGELRADQNVLITGIGGGVATSALQFAVAAGANVWVTSSSDRKIQHAISLGAEGGFDYRREGWPAELLEQCGPVDLIIDGAGGEDFGLLVETATPGGRIVSYGATQGKPPELDLFKVFWKQLRLIGSTLGTASDFEAMLNFVQHHQIQPVIDRVFPLDEANAALQEMANSPQFGKLVLNCSI